jgi:hypothetical protein
MTHLWRAIVEKWQRWQRNTDLMVTGCSLLLLYSEKLSKFSVGGASILFFKDASAPVDFQLTLWLSFLAFTSLS